MTYDYLQYSKQENENNEDKFFNAPLNWIKKTIDYYGISSPAPGFDRPGAGSGCQIGTREEIILQGIHRLLRRNATARRISLCR